MQTATVILWISLLMDKSERRVLRGADKAQTRVEEKEPGPAHPEGVRRSVSLKACRKAKPYARQCRSICAASMVSRDLLTTTVDALLAEVVSFS